MTTRASLVCWLVWLLVVTGSGSASASESTPDGLPPGYQQAVDLGVDELGRGNHAEARSRFMEAHAIYPNARTLRALGMVEYELKNYAGSIDYLAQALRASERPLTDALRKSTEELLDRARGYLARYRLSTTPPQVVVTLDGAAITPAADGALILSVGEHQLEVHAPGYQPVRRTLHVSGRIDLDLHIALVPLPSPPAPAPRETAARADEGPTRKRWLWVGAAGALAAGVVATALLVRRDPGSAEPSGGTTGVIIPVPPPSRTVR